MLEATTSSVMRPTALPPSGPKVQRQPVTDKATLLLPDQVRTSPTARGPVPVASTLSLASGDKAPAVDVQVVVMPTHLPHRSTDFDRYVLMARFLHQSDQSLIHRHRVIDLLSRAEQSAQQTRSLDQLQWLARAYQTEFRDLPGAMYKAQSLEFQAKRLLMSGDFTLSAYQYPGFDYGPYPGYSLPAPKDDPYGVLPDNVDRQQQTRDMETYWQMLQRHRDNDARF